MSASASLPQLGRASTRRTAILAIAVIGAAFLAYWEVPGLHMGLGTAQEMRTIDADEAQIVRSLWHMWTHRTLDYQKAIHTGYYYNTSLAAGALLVPWLGNRQETFALAARYWLLLQGMALILLATYLLGEVCQWRWPVAFLPVFLALDPQYHLLSAVLRVDMSMWFWLFCATWSLSRFLVRPDRPRYRAAVIFATLAFAAKPAVLPFGAFFVAANLYQMWRDGQPLRTEWRWRTLKGLQYFAITLLLASPFTFFSPGLFVTSMRSELRATATKYLSRPAWDWVAILADPNYLGGGLLALGVALALLLAMLHARGRLPASDPEGRRLRIFAVTHGLWTLVFWGFILAESRSFLQRYLDPGLMAFLIVIVTGLCLLPRISRWGSIAGAVLLLAAFVPSVPARIATLEEYRAVAATRDRQIAPQRKFARELIAMLPRDARIMASAEALVDSDDFPNAEHIRRFRPRYFDPQPQYLLLLHRDIHAFDEYLGQDGTRSVNDAERALSAVFFDEIQHSLLYGTLEQVKTWDDVEITLYRFKVPTDAAFQAMLAQRIQSKAGVKSPR